MWQDIILVAAVFAAIFVCFSISLAVFAANSRQGIDDACAHSLDAMASAQTAADVQAARKNITISEGPLAGYSFDADAVDVCGTIKTVVDYGIWVVLAVVVVPDILILICSICVAHFAKVLKKLADAIGPMEASPLMAE